MFPSSKNIDGSNIDLTNYYTKTEIDTLINSQGQAYIPCGSVQAFMTTTAPQGYLVCDGTEYLKADYPQLASVLNTVDTTQNTTNFVGSDSNHFKVPDLRGEFLRGTGTNSHENQGNGANIGTHQNATQHIGVTPFGGERSFAVAEVNEISGVNPDSVIVGNNFRRKYTYSSTTDLNQPNYYTARPTNTSVLYCIAYQDLYLAPLHKYSTSEHIVGEWIDGKPLYEKTFTGQRFGTITDGSYSAVYYSVDGLNIDFGWTTEALVLIPEGHDAYGKRINCATSISGLVSSNTTYNLPTVPATGNLTFYSSVSGQSNCMTFVTIRYTKTTD